MRMKNTRDIQPIAIRDYLEQVRPTDKMPEAIEPCLMGLFGEVGSVMAASKKLHREKNVYIGFRQVAVEEFGDALWYLAGICRRKNLSLENLFVATSEHARKPLAPIAMDATTWPIALGVGAEVPPALDSSLLKLGAIAGALLVPIDQAAFAAKLQEFVSAYCDAMQACQIPFAEVARGNLEKTIGRFVEPNAEQLPTFDSDFNVEERLPEEFTIHVSQRVGNRAYLQWNGVFIGAPLTDNIADPDGYRFHDVFHIAHAAVLHWSPVFRALIQHKRKSRPAIDEAEDGGRAVVVEEGLAAWIFAQAKQLSFFEGHESVPFDLLKVVQRFVAGYEVEACPLNLWERAILQGYGVFREIRKSGGGLIVANRKTRSVEFKPLTAVSSSTAATPKP